MNSNQQTVAQDCLDGAYRNTLSFPASVQTLIAAGFDGYQVDYRANTRTYYLPTGETLTLTNPHPADPVTAPFQQAEITAAIRWAQAGAADYTYAGFNQRVTASGCAGYLVSFLGRRILYYGRTGETHVEMLPASR